MDTDTGLSMDTELFICIRIRGTHIRVPGGFGVPVSNTSFHDEKNRLRQDPDRRFVLTSWAY